MTKGVVHVLAGAALTAAGLTAAPRAAAHHVVSDSGVAWVEPVTVAQVDAEAGRVEAGGYEADYQLVRLRGEWAPRQELSLTIQLPIVHTRHDGGVLAGTEATGPGDLEFGFKARVLGLRHDRLVLSLGGVAELPTGDTGQALGGGHVGLAGYGILSSAFAKGWIVVAVASVAVAGDPPPRDGDPVRPAGVGDLNDAPLVPLAERAGALHGAAHALHTAAEARLRVRLARTLGPLYVAAGLEGVQPFTAEADPLLEGQVDAGAWLIRRRLRLAIGGLMPLAGQARRQWQAQAGLAYRF